MKWVYTLLILIGGLFPLVLTPPFQMADEPNHLFRAVQLSGGELTGEVAKGELGCRVPGAVRNDAVRFVPMIFRPEVGLSAYDVSDVYERGEGIGSADREDYTFVHCQFEHYPPVPHLPQTLAVLACRLTGQNTVAAVYLGRLFNLLAACAVLYCVFTLLAEWPRMQMLLFTLAGMPAMMALLASLTADPATIVFSFLLFALALRLRCQWTERTFWMLVGTSALLALCKNVYFPMVMLGFPAVLAMPRPALWKLGRIGILIATVIPLGLWMYYIRDFASVAALAGQPAKPGEQLAMVMASPGRALGEWASYVVRDHVYLRTAFIGTLGWGDFSIKTWFAHASGLVIVAVALIGVRGSSERRWRGWDAIWWICIFVGTSLLIYLALLVMTGRGAVIRTQGRYYVPILPLLLGALPIVVLLPAKWYRWWRVAVIGWWCVGVAVLVIALYGRFWAPELAPLRIGEMYGNAKDAGPRRGVLQQRENGDNVLLTAAPTTHMLSLGRGATRVRIEYGMLDAAWKGDPKSDGSEFQLVLQPRGSGPTVLWSQRLDPAQVESHRGAQLATVTLPAGMAGKVFFRTIPGPESPDTLDQAYWRNVVVEYGAEVQGGK